MTINFNGPIYSVDDFERGGQQGAAPLPQVGELDGKRNSCPDGVRVTI